MLSAQQQSAAQIARAAATGEIAATGKRSALLLPPALSAAAIVAFTATPCVPVRGFCARCDAPTIVLTVTRTRDIRQIL
ncbi:hypothetical protein GCM10027093_07770 [Paraburkholderia jirisanensis]